MPTRFLRAAVAVALAAAAAALLVLGPASNGAAAAAGSNGRIVFMGLDDFGIFTIDPDGGRERRLTRGLDVSPAWSPDGRKIAFADATKGNIWKMHANGSKQRRLTDDRQSFEPSWAPNGKRIVYVSRRGGDAEIVTMRTDGSHTRRVTRNGAEDFDPKWSPNGKMIVFVRSRSGREPDLFKINPSGGNKKRLTDTENRYEVAPAWSPDGTKIAFASGRRGDDEELYKVRSDGSKRRRLTNNAVVDSDPCWSPNGNKIALYSDGDLAKIKSGGGRPHVIVADAAWPDWRAR